MKRNAAHLLVIMLFTPFLVVSAQRDTLYIGAGFTQLPLHHQIHYFTSEQQITADSAWKVFQNKPVPIEKLDRINFGPINGFYWLALTVHNNADKEQDLYIQIKQPHLYRMVFYHVTDDSIYSVFETGIRYNFYQRPSPHRHFNFPFSCASGESFTILLMVHHINSLTLPISLASSATLHQYNYTENLIWGYWFGFLSFCSLLALMAFLVLRKSIFLWYFLYISSASLYGFTERGYGFQFVFPGFENLDALVIIQSSVYVFIFLIKFSQNLLSTRKHIPRIHNILNFVFYFLLTLLIAGVVAEDFMFRISTYVLPIVNIVVLIGLILLAYSGIRTFFSNRIIALFYLFAYMALVSASIYSTLTYAFGVTQYDGPNLILIAYFFEAVVLSMALVILFRQTQTERNQLNNQVAVQQKQMYQQYIDGIEKERGRIAGELHDDIGSRLSNIKQTISYNKEYSENTVSKIDALIQDVRRLSHDLAPPVAHVSGLQPLIEQFISETQKNSTIDFRLHFYDYEERFDANEIQQLYRIVQEAIQNIVTHSKATRADLQFFGYENEVNLAVEDNGVGFNPIDFKHGIGLNQMKIRSENLGGKIEINSHPGLGCHLLIQIPYKTTS